MILIRLDGSILHVRICYHDLLAPCPSVCRPLGVFLWTFKVFLLGNNAMLAETVDVKVDVLAKLGLDLVLKR